ncbi:UvrB/UvrC motif-containing protein [Chlamydia sp. 17-3921]|uniref:UvrB/UvrC motif-containing protein n=1 Tax=Chlamydia sp. 17-3921 TaxID=2675798 RepID=UPI0019185AEF|nr:UvrB/UvrC motif-containing protein [Chlamydia sp. 17-3921]
MTIPPTARCYQCQQQATVCYTEINTEKVLRSYVCSSCPYPSYYYRHENTLLCPQRDSVTLECGNCKTTWSFRQDGDQLLGCHQCYTNFKSQLLTKLNQNKAISSSFSLEKNRGFLHIGRSPGKINSANPLLKLIALNEALQDTLKREDYEQAAIIRDQINNLKTQDQDTHDNS